MRKAHEAHGDSCGKQARLYRIWRGMRDRCHSASRCDGAYQRRRITVCRAWRESYVAFRRWALANGYADRLTLDRIDGARGYSPKNCRWVTPKQQGENRLDACLVTARGKTLSVSDWSNVTGIYINTLYKRFHRGLRGDAFLAPPKQPKPLPEPTQLPPRLRDM